MAKCDLLDQTRITHRWCVIFAIFGHITARHHLPKESN
jgi:hypothetical protein